MEEPPRYTLQALHTLSWYHIKEKKMKVYHTVCFKIERKHLFKDFYAFDCKRYQLKFG